MDRAEIIEWARSAAPRFAARADEGEAIRRLPPASAQEFLNAGLARILTPRRYGGHELGFETWFDVVREISKADCSHGWCASLICNHSHILAQFTEEAQQAVWSNGPDLAITTSVIPSTRATLHRDGYRVSGTNAFASGIDHSAWAIIGSIVDNNDGNAPEWYLFLLPASDYTIRDTWFTTGMRATGSKTIATDNVLVPRERALPLSDLRNGTGPGAEAHKSQIYRTPFSYYGPLTLSTPILGAAQGACDHFKSWIMTRKVGRGIAASELQSVQIAYARASADLDAAEFLVRRAARVPDGHEPLSPLVLARSVRDYSRAVELSLAAVDALLDACGTAGFAEGNPIQRAWRDLHLAAKHVSLTPETNFVHYSRMHLALGRDPAQPFF